MQFILISELGGHLSWAWKVSGIVPHRVEEWYFIEEELHEPQQEGGLEMLTSLPDITRA